MGGELRDTLKLYGIKENIYLYSSLSNGLRQWSLEVTLCCQVFMYCKVDCQLGLNVLYVMNNYKEEKEKKERENQSLWWVLSSVTDPHFPEAKAACYRMKPTITLS